MGRRKKKKKLNKIETIDVCFAVIHLVLEECRPLCATKLPEGEVVNPFVSVQHHANLREITVSQFSFETSSSKLRTSYSVDQVRPLELNISHAGAVRSEGYSA